MIRSDLSSSYTRIPVCTIGMDARKEAVFRMAFKMFTKRQYYLQENDDAQTPAVFIVDVDGVDGAKSLAIARRLRAEHPEQRILLTSNGLADGGLADGGHYDGSLAGGGFPTLQKPVRMESLFSALDQLLAEGQNALDDAAENRVGDISMQPTSRTPLHETNPPGVAPDISSANVLPASTPISTDAGTKSLLLRPEDIRYFDPQAGLLGLLRTVQRDPSPVVIHDRQKAIMRLHPAKDQATLLVDDTVIQDLAREKQPHLQKRTAEDPGVTDQEPKRSQTFQSVLWQVAAWAADGRMMRQLRVSTRVQLKYWPNLTRLAMLPDAMRMSAFLARSPETPVLTVKMLRVAPTDLFNFLAAVDSLGLLRYHSTESPDDHTLLAASLPSADGNPLSTVEVSGGHAPTGISETPAAKRSFLGRILARITGL